MFSSMFEPWSYKLCPLHTCRQYHSKSPVSLMSVCYWSCLSVYLEIKMVIMSNILLKTTFEMCKCLIANRICYDRNKNQNIQVIAFFITLNLVFLLGAALLFIFFFVCVLPQVYWCFFVGCVARFFDGWWPRVLPCHGANHFCTFKKEWLLRKILDEI